MNPITRYIRWLHTQWPAGKVEHLPVVGPQGQTNIPGVYVVGDLAGVPLLKFAADSASRAIDEICKQQSQIKNSDESIVDVIIIGAGVAGIAAMAQAKEVGLNAVIVEASDPYSTLINMPKGKPIYTYPTEMIPAGPMEFEDSANTKERLLEDLGAFRAAHGIEPHQGRVTQVVRRRHMLESHLEDGHILRSRFVVVAIGRTGDFRRLDVPGESLPKVSNLLRDPNEFADKQVLVVGGGDSAVEASIALVEAGADVTLSYRGETLSRPKPQNVTAIEKIAREGATGVSMPGLGYMEGDQSKGSLNLLLGSHVKSIEEDQVTVTNSHGEQVIRNDAVFTLIGRQPPIEFLKRSGLAYVGRWTPKRIAAFVAIILVACFVYQWKSNAGIIPIESIFKSSGWFPFNMTSWSMAWGALFSDPTNIFGTLAVSLGEPGFYYSLAYCLAVVIFGIRRIRRRQTAYVTKQTITLMSIQVVPLFLLPYLLLPLLGHNGYLDLTVIRPIADALFPVTDYGQGREYWRAFGLILAWPLFIWNVFTVQPLWTWLIISLVQTFVIIPIIIRYWGKGAYCGWICSCGALAETVGDQHRHKMPHGPMANRLNVIGQVFLLAALFLLITRIISWIWPESFFGEAYDTVLTGVPFFNYVFFVDLLWAGIIGVGFYWHFSGRVWCRFACPLAALMHIYARFSRFRILSDKKKCISCNVCTTVCHQGIDVMSFANKGLPMEDPECVRCSACVQSCPTGVLSFGQINRKTGEVISRDRTLASPVQRVELTLRGSTMAD